MPHESISSSVVALPNGHKLYDFEAEHGVLDAIYQPEVGWFCISNIDVEPQYRRQGLGKLLLRAAFTEAERLRARLIYAAITSRECLDAMSEVFGKAAIKVSHEGTYTPDGSSDRYDARAMLWSELK
jgi:GNAT superfamily N-acetyltransferase